MAILRKNEGFTLMELVITLLIFAIICTIAIPSYLSYLLKSHRTDGINALDSIQLEQEKYRSNNSSYATLSQLWGGVTDSPGGYYTLSITNSTSTGYVATATAIGSQANDTQNGTSCAVLTLTVNGLNTSQTPSACWTY